MHQLVLRKIIHILKKETNILHKGKSIVVNKT